MPTGPAGGRPQLRPGADARDQPHQRSQPLQAILPCVALSRHRDVRPARQRLHGVLGSAAAHRPPTSSQIPSRSRRTAGPHASHPGPCRGPPHCRRQSIARIHLISVNPRFLSRRSRIGRPCCTGSGPAFVSGRDALGAGPPGAAERSRRSSRSSPPPRSCLCRPSRRAPRVLADDSGRTRSTSAGAGTPDHCATAVHPWMQLC